LKKTLFCARAGSRFLSQHFEPGIEPGIEHQKGSLLSKFDNASKKFKYKISPDQQGKVSSHFNHHKIVLYFYYWKSTAEND